MEELFTVLIVAAAFAGGATLQRISGMGVGLITAPILAWWLGPIDGVFAVNVLAAVNAALNAISARRYISWRTVALMGPAVVIGSIPAAFIIPYFSTGALTATIGALLLIAMALVLGGGRVTSRRARRTGHSLADADPAAPLTRRSQLGAMLAGFAGGAMNTLAAVAGPAFTVYAQAARWEHRMFAATLQPLFVLCGLASFLAKLWLDVGVTGSLTIPVWAAGMVGMLLGIGLGARLVNRIPVAVARRVALIVATLGAATVLLRGVSELLAGA